MNSPTRSRSRCGSASSTSRRSTRGAISATEELRLNQRLRPRFVHRVVPIHGDPQAPSLGRERAGDRIRGEDAPHEPTRLASVRLAHGELTCERSGAFRATAGMRSTATAPVADAERRLRARRSASPPTSLHAVAALPPGDARGVGEALRQWFDAQARGAGAGLDRAPGRGTRARVPWRPSPGQRRRARTTRCTAFDCLEFDAGPALDRRAQRRGVPDDGPACAWPARSRARLSSTPTSRPAATTPACRCCASTWSYRALVRAHGRRLREGQSGVRPATPGSRRLPDAGAAPVAAMGPAPADHARPAGFGQDLGHARAAASHRRDPRALRCRAREAARQRPLRRRRYARRSTAGSARWRACRWSSGYPTIVDAACLQARASATRCVRWPRRCACRSRMLDCTAPIDVLRQRVRDRAAARRRSRRRPTRPCWSCCSPSRRRSTPTKGSA